MTIPAPDLDFADYGLWLGKPKSMTALPTPDSGLSAPADRAGVSHQLASGGTSVTRVPAVRRVYGLRWANRTVDQLDAILGYQAGARGAGPWIVVDTTLRNLLDPAVASFGAFIGLDPGWAAYNADIDYSTSLSVDSPFPNSNIAQWIQPANNQYMLTGTFAGLPTLRLVSDAARPYAPPYIPSLPYTFSVYARSATGTVNVTPVIIGLDDGGDTGNEYAGTATAVGSTTWQRLTVSMPPGAVPADSSGYLVCAMKCTSTPAADLLFAAAQLEVGTSATPWVLGLGTPRVTIQDPIANDYAVWTRRSTALVLAEV